MVQHHSVLEPKLPLDIISLVSFWHVLIESGGADRVDFWPPLKTMCLIARAWLQPCRDVLFEHFHLGTHRESKLKDYLEVSRFVFLLLHPRIAQHVKFAHIWNDRLPSAAAAEVIAGMPTAFPNLSCFQIESIRFNQPPKFMTLIPKMLRQLSRLEFLDVMCVRNVMDPSKLCLEDLRLKHIRIMAPAQKLLPLMQAAVASLEQAAQPVRSGTFLASIFTDLGLIERMHHALSVIKTWTRLKIMYQGAVLTTLSTTNPALSLGRHLHLSSLSIFTFVKPNIAWLFHSLLVEIHLPALRQLSITIVFDLTFQNAVVGIHLTIPIPLEGDEPEILPRALSGQLKELVFLIATSNCGSPCVITIPNWSTFRQLFLPPASCTVKLEYIRSTIILE